MEADWADGGIGLKVGGFVPEKQPSRHGGSGDARNKEAQPQQQAAGGLRRSLVQSWPSGRARGRAWAGPGAGPSGTVVSQASRGACWASRILERKEATCHRKVALGVELLGGRGGRGT